MRRHSIREAVTTGALLALPALFLFCATPARADGAAEVRGTITAADGRPLAGVVVQYTAVGIASKPFVVKSRKDGTYVFPFLPYSQGIKYDHTYTLPGYRMKWFHVVSRQPRTSADKGEGTVIQDDSGSGGSEGKPVAVLPKPGGTVHVDIQLMTDQEYQDMLRQRSAAAAAAAAAASGVSAAPAEVVPADPIDRARALAGAGKPEEAIAGLQASIAEEATAQKWLVLGQLQAAGDDSSAATRSFSRASALDPEMKGIHLQIGKLLSDDGRIPEATAELEKERALQPEDPATLRALASLYAQGGRGAEAIPIYEGLTAAADASPDLLTRLAALYREAGQTKKAEGIYERIALANPKDSDAMYYKMGRSIMDQKTISDGDRARAVDAFRKAIEANPRNALAHRELGYALLGMGDLDGARSHLKKFLELKPDDKDAGEVRGMLKDLG